MQRTLYGTLVGTLVFLMFWPAAAQAAKGSCSQPASNGQGPVASDCLYILRVAVGAIPCGPKCICAPKGSLPTVASDALLCLRKSVGQDVTLGCPCAVTVVDDFNDNSKGPQRWGSDSAFGSGVLNETSQRLQYTVIGGTGFDLARRAWIASELPFSGDWIVQLDVSNQTSPTQNDEICAPGVSVFRKGNSNHEMFHELYASHLNHAPARYGFNSGLYEDGDEKGNIDTEDLGISSGTVRVEFDAASKVMSLYYDATIGDEQAWLPLARYGIDGSGGDASADWGMDEGDRFVLGVYGFSMNMSISPGQMSSDNFAIDGAVAP
jgi:hypothetical protein